MSFLFKPPGVLPFWFLPVSSPFARPKLPLSYPLILHPANNVYIHTLYAYSVQNLKRVVEVWFDEYKEYFYRSKPEALLVSPGNIEKQLEFRRTHNCKSFSWFMSEIAPDIVNKYPLPAANIHWGEVRSASHALFSIKLVELCRS